MKIMQKKNSITIAIAGILVLISGCTNLGPKTIEVDRFDYSTAVADSWKQQTLLNIVKLRYMDLPVFMDVASIVSGYSIEMSANVMGQISSADAIQGNSVALGGSGKYTDRPTTTYVPMTGENFLHGLLTPIDPKKIFFMLQTGYAADFIVQLTVESINGVRNRSATGGSVREADPNFSRILILLREVQEAGALGMRVETDANRGQTTLLIFRPNDLSPEIVGKISELHRLLKLPPDRQEFVITYSPVRGAEHELAISSRSMLQVMKALASYVEVPEAHLTDQSAIPGFTATNMGNEYHVASIRSGVDKPDDAFIAIQYRGYWFWIDQNDWKTKRALTAVMFFFTLVESSGNENLPLITIPAQ